MKNGACVKCGSASIRMVTNGISDHSGHTTMYPHIEGRPFMIRPEQGQASQLACTDCGYLEWWVLDPETIRFIEEKWAPVNPS